jgi:hypothetical protein
MDASQGKNTQRDAREAMTTPGSLTDIVDKVRGAVSTACATDGNYPYVVNVEKKTVVYELANQLYRQKYTYANGVATLSGTPEAVVISYIPATDVTESHADQVDGGLEVAESGDLTTLTASEAYVGPDGTALVRFITPGEGSTGHYSAEVLRRDVGEAFPAGTQMFINHPTDAEKAARPEGDLMRLGAVFTSPAEYKESGPEGPGAYATMKVLEKHRAFINEAAAFTGLSIRAACEGRTRPGKSPEITRIVKGHSVDFVTRAGRGGKVVQAFEAAGRGEYVSGFLSTEPVQIETKENAPPMSTENKTTVEGNPALIAALQTAEAATKATKGLLARVLIGDAKEAAGELLDTAGVKDSTIRAKIMQRVIENIPVLESGDFDAIKLGVRVKEVSESEFAYLRSVVGDSPKLKNLGLAASESTTTGAATEVKETLADVFGGPGFKLGPDAAKIAGK